MLHGETINHHVALTSLIAFHRVNADVFERRHAQRLYRLPNHGNLIAIGNNHANRFISVESRAIKAMNATQHLRHELRFMPIYFVRSLHFVAFFRWNKQHTMLLQRLI